MTSRQMTITLDHGPADLDPDDLVVYAASGEGWQCPAWDLGPDYEPVSPGWIAALLPVRLGAETMYRPLWARVYRPTMAARERREAQAQADADRRAEARLAALWDEAGMAIAWPGLAGVSQKEALRLCKREGIAYRVRDAEGLRWALMAWARGECQ